MKSESLRTVTFWAAIVSALSIFIQAILRLFGIEFSEKDFVDVVNAANILISALAVGGILINPEKVSTLFTKKTANDEEDEETATLG